MPSDAAYRLYLDFQHNGKVRTAEFTVVAGSVPTGVTSPPPAQPGPTGHADQPHGHG
ncbi:hypothetical protein ACFQX7_29355 [Luedemannella flava]